MYKAYQVIPSDTLSSIAKKYNITEEEIAKINGINVNSNLIPGTFIVVPVSSSIFDQYTIQKGDTIYSVASKLNIKPDDLIILNGLNKNDYIYPNETLLIPKQGYGFYVTKDNDTLSNVISNTNTSISMLLEQNPNIYLTKDQLLIYKKDII